MAKLSNKLRALAGRIESDANAAYISALAHAEALQMLADKIDGKKTPRLGLAAAGRVSARASNAARPRAKAQAKRAVAKRAAKKTAKKAIRKRAARKPSFRTARRR